MSKKLKGLSHGWNIVVWFFLGSVVSLIAYDWSDYVNYSAQASGQILSPFQQVFYYALFPSILYLVIAGIALAIGYLRLMSPWHFVEAFIILVVVVPAVFGLLLPQAHDPIFAATILAGTVASVVIGLGLRREVKK